MNRWNRFRKSLEKPWAAYTFALCCAVVLFVFLSHIDILWRIVKALYHYIYPVLIGLIIAYILDPMVKFWEGKVLGKMKNRPAARGLGVLFTFALVVLFISILLIAMVPQLISSVRMFIENLGGYSATLNSMLEDLQKFAAEHNVDISSFIDSVGDILGTITRSLPQMVNRVLNTTISYGVEIANLIISAIVAIYILLDKNQLLKGSKRLWKAVTDEKSYQVSNNFLGRCNAILLQYILFDLLDGLIIGVLNALFMLIVRYPYVPLISVIVGVTNLAPTFGPIMGAIIGGSILLLINPWYALGFLIFTIALQTVDGYIIKPKLFGGQLGIPSLWVLISLIIFGRMWGVVGILIAIPVAAILDFIYQEEILVRLERRRKRLAAAEAAAKSVAHADSHSSGHTEKEKERPKDNKAGQKNGR